MLEIAERGTDFRSHLAANHAADPNRQAKLASFLDKGWPTHRDEEFRFTPLRDLAELELSLPSKKSFSSERFNSLPISRIEGPRVVFVNGFFDQDLSNLGEVSGVDVKIGTSPKVGSVATYEGKLGSTNDSRFIDLNDALYGDAAIISIAAGTVVETPITVVFVTDSDEPVVTHPRIWMELGKGAQAKLVEAYFGESGQYFTNAVTEIWLDQGAILEHTRVQQESRDAFHIAHVWAHQEPNSTYTSNSVQFGGKVGRVDVNGWLNGEHTETWLNGTYVGRSGQILDNKTRLDHAFPNCHSFEVYKGILDDDAQGVFNGKIFVYQDAQKTDAKQTNQALLLSPGAVINTKPQLEIFADDVKCTHGATVGQLQSDHLFYLRSRGIPESEARSMLVYAFAAEVLEKITIEQLRNYLEEELYRKLSG